MLSTEQKTGQLYKHFLNVSDTRDTRDFYEEAIQSSFCIRPDQLLMYGDEIPRSDGENANEIRNLKDRECFTWQKDESTKIDIVKCYKDYPLEKIDNGTDNAFKLVDSDGEPIRNVIPFNYYKDLYNYDLKTRGGQKIYFGVGDWVLDTYSGVLKFYGDVPEGVNHDNPPTLSFYQYVGGTGFRQDTFGYDGVIVPITGWRISKNEYLIDTENMVNGTKVSLEDQISKNANAIQENYTKTFGFDGDDKNEGVAYSLQKIISLTYTSSLDNVKGYDDSANSDIGTLLSRKSAEIEESEGVAQSGLKVTFCSQNVSKGTEHKLTISKDGTVRFDNGKSKTLNNDGPTKLVDSTEKNFIVVEKDPEFSSLQEGEFTVNVEEVKTSGILLYWDRKEHDYLPFINKETDDYNFGFPVVAANGRIPPSVSIGAISLNDYKDSITPEYYGPRNYTVTIAVEGGDQVKSADYVVRNTTGAFLDDIINRIVSDYTDSEGNFKFIGSIFLRAGTYRLSNNTLDLSAFKNLNFIGEDKYTTKIEGDLDFNGDATGILTVSNISLEDVKTDSKLKNLYLNETILKKFESTKGENIVSIKNSSLESIKIDKDASSSSTEPNDTNQNDGTNDTAEPGVFDNTNKLLNIITGSTIGKVDISTGYTLLNGDTIGELKLHNVLNDFIKSCFIQKVISKPKQTTLVGSTVFDYVETPFTQIPHMKHFPIYSQNSDKCLEYATFDSPFRIDYSQKGNKITIALDSEYLFINDNGELSCNLNAGSIIVDVSKLERHSSYGGKKPDVAIPNQKLQEALEDLYSTKADLNPDGKIPLDEIPDSVAYGGLLFVGTWSFEQKDEENSTDTNVVYKDGGPYPEYKDANKNFTADEDQKGILQPGWFWIVDSSKKDEDKPAAIQIAAPQTVNGKEEILKFTAGDWVIWNGTYFEKLDRAYQDAAYSVLPVYTTGEHLRWSWKNQRNDNNSWGLGALELGGETVAESFDMVNQELRKLWVKHPGVLKGKKLIPYGDYKTLEYIKIPTDGGTASSSYITVAYDAHKDLNVKNFTVTLPRTDPKWKSSIFVGDKCTFSAGVDGHEVTCEYQPENKDITKIGDGVELTVEKSIDPFDDEIAGSKYWKSVYLRFNGKNLGDGTHNFVLGLDNIEPDNDFTKDAKSNTDLYTIEIADKYEFNDSMGKIEVSGVNFISDLKTNLKNCSGVKYLTRNVDLAFTNVQLPHLVDAINSSGEVISLHDELNDRFVDIPLSSIKWSKSQQSDEKRYNASFDYTYNLPVEKVSENVTFSLRVKDVYGNTRDVSLTTINYLLAPGLDERERVNSSYDLYPTIWFGSSSSEYCGHSFDSSKLLTDQGYYELMKESRQLETGEVVQDYGWPTKEIYNWASDTDARVDYSDLDGDSRVENFRWVTFNKYWTGDRYEGIQLNENSGFTLDINVADDVKYLFTTDLYSMSTCKGNLIIMAKVVNVNANQQDDKGIRWFDCNAPYDGFSEVGKMDGQAAMYAGSSNALSKRITFGKDTYSGDLFVRVGIKKDSGLRIKNLTVRDLI